MKRSSGPRKTADLSESVHQQLSMYALAASTAGVGMLALTQPSEAKIVYTSTHQVLIQGSSYSLDFNGDGITDLTFQITTTKTYTSDNLQPHFWDVLRVNYRIYGDNAVVAKRRGYGSSLSYAALALKPGVRIGPKSPFQGGIINMERINSRSGRAPRGHWLDVKNRYLGVRFAIKGEIHYGWARLSVREATDELTATLTGYAYETIPNKPITAAQTKGTEDRNTEVPDASLTMPTPEPATLGALAMGAPGLSIWRRKESALQGE